VTQILRGELPNIEFKVLSLYSPDVADALRDGTVDVGFLRIEPRPGVHYQVVAREPLVVIMPGDHRLATASAIDPGDPMRPLRWSRRTTTSWRRRWAGWAVMSTAARTMAATIRTAMPGSNISMPRSLLQNSELERVRGAVAAGSL
jgi:DNA-binding transcriptional LysR family regulator